MFELTLVCPECRKRFEVLRLLRGTDVVRCPSCNEHVLHTRELAGFVYVLSNEMMPGVVKIGFTERSVSERMVELSASTGVAVPFTEEASFPVSDPSACEGLVHEALDRFRVSANREFFRLTVGEAVTIIREKLSIEPVFSVSGTGASAVASMVMLYRSIGPTELAAIQSSRWRQLQSSPSETTLFTVFTVEEHAAQLARDWNAKFEGQGFVIRFKVDASYVSRFPKVTVASRDEVWVPMQKLGEFNSKIVGAINVIHEFPKKTG